MARSFPRRLGSHGTRKSNKKYWCFWWVRWKENFWVFFTLFSVYNDVFIQSLILVPPFQSFPLKVTDNEELVGRTRKLFVLDISTSNATGLMKLGVMLRISFGKSSRYVFRICPTGLVSLFKIRLEVYDENFLSKVALAPVLSVLYGFLLWFSLACKNLSEYLELILLLSFWAVSSFQEVYHREKIVFL